MNSQDEGIQRKVSETILVLQCSMVSYKSVQITASELSENIYEFTADDVDQS